MSQTCANCREICQLQFPRTTYIYIIHEYPDTMPRCQEPHAHTLGGAPPTLVTRTVPVYSTYYQPHARQGCVGHMRQQHSPLAPHASNGVTTTLGAVLGDWCKLALALTMVPQGKIHPQCVVGAMGSSISCGFGQPRNKADASHCSF